MPTLFYGVFLEITETSVLVSCLLCFRCSCWSAFGGGGGGLGIWKNCEKLRSLHSDLVEDKIFVFAILFTKKSVRDCCISTQGTKSFIVLQVILNIQKKCI